MSQHDMNVANGGGATVRADINNALVALATASSGATEPATTYAYQFWADTTAGLLKQRNAANTGWEVRGTLAETMAVARSSNTILAAGDYKKFFRATASFTQTLTAAATLGDGWYVLYRVDSGATVTIDPNASETIDGATTRSIVGPAAGIIFCDGSGFLTYGFDQPAASDTFAGIVEIAVQSEMEAGSDTGRAVTPGRQHFHPSAAKVWCTGDFAANISASYNVTSLTDNGTGQVTVNIATDFSSASYVVVAAPHSAGSVVVNKITTKAAGSTKIDHFNLSGVTVDIDSFNMAAFGDQ